MSDARSLTTKRGIVPFPAYVPVTTFGGRYPLDELVRPYLPRLARAVMISHHYARQAAEEDLPELPRFIDSGGFASLFERARVIEEGGLGIIEIATDEGTDRVHPRDVLDLQERIADVAFTLDFPIPPGTASIEAIERLRLTQTNARWALVNRRSPELRLFGCVQGWDVESARRCAADFAKLGFDGIAIGGLVPRVSDRVLLANWIAGVRAEIGDLPLHVFGLGHPDLAALAFTSGADSVDSSSYVKLAANGRTWLNPTHRVTDPSPTERLHLALNNLAVATGAALPMSAYRR